MQTPPLIWAHVLLFAVTTTAAVTIVPWYGLTYGYQAADWIALFVLYVFSGLSITAGYHRLWSHKSYRAHPVIKLIWALGGTMALENSILHWSSDHRNHHKDVDNNDKDPYSAKMGFWYSHIGWMLREYHSQRYHDYSNVRDLQKDKIVMWQHKYYTPLVLLTTIGIPLLLGILTGHIVSMFLLAGVLRMVVVHQGTFLINSLAHIWGKQTYTDQNTSRDNGIIAFFTYGEGYHNFHHLFEHDYRNGIKWWHFDPTKWVIKTLSWCGLTRGLRIAPQEKIESAKLQMQLKSVQNKIAHLPNCDEVLHKLQQEYDTLKSLLLDYYQAKKSLLEAKRKQLTDKHHSANVAELKLRFQLQYKNWKMLTSHCLQI